MIFKNRKETIEAAEAGFLVPISSIADQKLLI